MSNPVYLVTCRSNPDTIFGVGSSPDEAKAIINASVDSANDSLSSARYDHVIENGLDPNEDLDMEEYAEPSVIRQSSPDNYAITEMPLDRPGETNLQLAIMALPSHDPDDEDCGPNWDEDEDGDCPPGDPNPDDLEGDPDWDEDEAEEEPGPDSREEGS